MKPSMFEDIVEMSKIENVNIELLIEDAFNRGFREGIIFAKGKAIEAIQLEK